MYTGQKKLMDVRTVIIWTGSTENAWRGKTKSKNDAGSYRKARQTCSISCTIIERLAAFFPFADGAAVQRGAPIEHDIATVIQFPPAKTSSIGPNKCKALLPENEYSDTKIHCFSWAYQKSESALNPFDDTELCTHAAP